MSTGNVLFPGGSELDQLQSIYRVLGTPTEEVWPGVTRRKMWNEDAPKLPPQNLASIVPSLGDEGIDLLAKMLTYDPAKRISAKVVLQHPYFVGLEHGSRGT
ncbi:cell division control protein 2 homolog B-like [Helianthus annuus]|uniref:cell division control protein 2 homolog B-like n=1 Tax=Helianthus annuus TaxID=4232 RepID=UPI000B907124|nr:cell division control protein 2 homolog B-like [Helianthus annuus]